MKRPSQWKKRGLAQVRINCSQTLFKAKYWPYQNSDQSCQPSRLNPPKARTRAQRALGIENHWSSSLWHYLRNEWSKRTERDELLKYCLGFGSRVKLRTLQVCTDEPLCGSRTLCGAVAWLVLVTVSILVKGEIKKQFKRIIIRVLKYCRHMHTYDKIYIACGVIWCKQHRG
jgi:hypothetical protein